MRLFWVTWFLIAAAALHLLGDLHYMVMDIQKLRDTTSAVTDQTGRIEGLWGAELIRLGLSGYYFAPAAMVELLYRIWRRQGLTPGSG